MCDYDIGGGTQPVVHLWFKQVVQMSSVIGLYIELYIASPDLIIEPTQVSMIYLILSLDETLWPFYPSATMPNGSYPFPELSATSGW